MGGLPNPIPQSLGLFETWIWTSYCDDSNNYNDNNFQGDYKTFGRLMVESHNSLRDDFEVRIVVRDICFKV